MIKKTLSVILALFVILSAASLTLFTASAEEFADATATTDEATTDEATVDEPKLVLTAIDSEVDGTVIGRMGDINDDKKINVKDSTLMQKHLARIICLNEKSKALCDVDNNQKFNIKDATTLQKYIAKFDVDCVVLYTLYETGTHTHSYIESVVEVKCETEGYTLYSCICGDERKENVVEAKGHDYKVKRVDATCVDEGYTLYSCNNCFYSYKKDVAESTGKHVFEKDVCKHCDMKKSVYSFDVLKEFVVEKGEYMSETDTYYYNLDTGYESDAAAVMYVKSEDALAITYAAYFEDALDLITIALESDKEEFSFYMICSGVFESAGTFDMSKYTVHVKDIDDIEYYYYVDDIKESDCLAYTLDFIDAALTVYSINESKLPSTIRELGFSNFVVQ